MFNIDHGYIFPILERLIHHASYLSLVSFCIGFICLWATPNILPKILHFGLFFNCFSNFPVKISQVSNTLFCRYNPQHYSYCLVHSAFNCRFCFISSLIGGITFNNIFLYLRLIFPHMRVDIFGFLVPIIDIKFLSRFNLFFQVASFLSVV